MNCDCTVTISQPLQTISTPSPHEIQKFVQDLEEEGKLIVKKLKGNRATFDLVTDPHAAPVERAQARSPDSTHALFAYCDECQLTWLLGNLYSHPSHHSMLSFPDDRQDMRSVVLYMAVCTFQTPGSLGNRSLGLFFGDESRFNTSIQYTVASDANEPAEATNRALHYLRDVVVPCRQEMVFANLNQTDSHRKVPITDLIKFRVVLGMQPTHAARLASEVFPPPTDLGLDQLADRGVQILFYPVEGGPMVDAKDLARNGVGTSGVQGVQSLPEVGVSEEEEDEEGHERNWRHR